MITQRMLNSAFWRRLSLFEDKSAPLWWYVRVTWTSASGSWASDAERAQRDQLDAFIRDKKIAVNDGWESGSNGEISLYFFTQYLDELTNEIASWIDQNAPSADVSFTTRLTTRGEPENGGQALSDYYQTHAAPLDRPSRLREQVIDDDDDARPKNFALIFVKTRSGHTKQTYDIDYRVDHVPAHAPIEEIIDKAVSQLRINFRNRASKGPFEVQTEHGIWKRSNGGVFYNAKGQLYPDVRFKSWEDMEAEEQNESTLTSRAHALRESLTR